MYTRPYFQHKLTLRKHERLCRVYDLSCSQGIATHRTGNSSDDLRHLQGVDRQKDARPPVTLFIGFLRISIDFLSSLENYHPIRTLHNKQARTDKKHEAQATGHPWPKVPPRKENNTITAAFQGGGFSLFSLGSNCLFSSLPLSLSSGLRLACVVAVPVSYLYRPASL